MLTMKTRKNEIFSVRNGKYIIEADGKKVEIDASEAKNSSIVNFLAIAFISVIPAWSSGNIAKAYKVGRFEAELTDGKISAERIDDRYAVLDVFGTRMKVEMIPAAEEISRDIERYALEAGKLGGALYRSRSDVRELAASYRAQAANLMGWVRETKTYLDTDDARYVMRDRK